MPKVARSLDCPAARRVVAAPATAPAWDVMSSSRTSRTALGRGSNGLSFSSGRWCPAWPQGGRGVPAALRCPPWREERQTMVKVTVAVYCPNLVEVGAVRPRTPVMFTVPGPFVVLANDFLAVLKAV